MIVVIKKVSCLDLRLHNLFALISAVMSPIIMSADIILIIIIIII